MGRNSRRIKDRAIEIYESDDYQEAKNTEFDQQLKDFLTADTETIVSEDDIQGFLDSFTFPDKDEWCMNKACGETEDAAEARYEQMKDERIGLCQ